MPRRAASARIAACLVLTPLAPGNADPAPVIHYAPTENLEHVDVALIDRAEHEIDMAAYVLTDWPVMQALTHAADRGVMVRIYLDVAETPGVEIRVKHETSAPMHLKSYQIDGRLLRTGAANFSASGLKRQDNAATVHCATPTSIVVGAPAPATTIANDATTRRAEAADNRAEIAAAGGNKDADVMIENMKTYASNCAEAYFRTKSGTFKSLALLSGGLGECQFLTLNNTMPGVVADKKIMDRYIEIDNLPTRAEQDKEIETESATIIGTMFGIRDIVTNILWAELAKHCTYLGGKNETSEVSCK